MIFNRHAVHDHLRKEQMTMAELVEATGLSFGYVSDLMSGRKLHPSRKVVREIARVLDANPRSLLFEDPETVTQ